MALTSDQEEELQRHLEIPLDHPKLGGWDKKFLKDLAEQYEEKGAQTIVTSKMWVQLARIDLAVNGA